MLNLFFCMRRKKNSGVGKGLRAGDREERDSGDSGCFLSLPLRHREQQHARMPWEPQDRRARAPGCRRGLRWPRPLPGPRPRVQCARNQISQGPPRPRPSAWREGGALCLRGRLCRRGANLTLTGVRCQGRGHGPTAEKAHRDTEDAGPARLARSSTPGLLPGKPTSLCRAGPQRDKQNRISAFTGKT